MLRIVRGRRCSGGCGVASLLRAGAVVKPLTACAVVVWVAACFPSLNAAQSRWAPRWASWA